MTQIVPYEQRVADLKEHFGKRKDGLFRLLPNGIKEGRFLQIVFQEVTRNPQLLECTPASLFVAVAECFRLGLEPGGALGMAFMVPYFDKSRGGNVCQFQAGYRGFVALAHRPGKVVSVDANTVYPGDEFDYQLGSDAFVRHKLGPEHPGTPEELQYAYAVVKLTSGGTQYVVLNRKQIEGARKRSPAGRDGKGPWITDYDAMALKTAVRRAMKLAPLSSELSRATMLDELAEAGLPQPIEAELEVAEAQPALPAESKE